MKQRHTNIVAVFLVALKNNQVLLSLRKNTGYRDGEYGLVSGHVEKGESITQAMIREAKEEAGIILSIKNLEMIHLQHRKSDQDKSERIDVFFRISKWQGRLRNCEFDKCKELRFVNIHKLPANTVPNIRYALKNIIHKVYYSEYGWNKPEKKKNTFKQNKQ